MNTIIIVCAAIMAFLWFISMMRLRKQENDHIMEMAAQRREYSKDLMALHDKSQEVKELTKEIGGLEMLVRLKDEELNSKDNEIELSWQNLYPYLDDVKKTVGHKVLLISSCENCYKKDCPQRTEKSGIPEDCPLIDVHVLHEVKIVGKCFSLAQLWQQAATVEVVKEQIKEKEGVA